MFNWAFFREKFADNVIEMAANSVANEMTKGLLENKNKGTNNTIGLKVPVPFTK